MSVSWFLLWALTTFWNPIFFWGTWTGMALVTYDIGYAGHPGYKRHFMLSLTSIPLWWWFEVVNRRIMNWEYVSAFDYDPLQYFLFASLSFSTVGPALDAAHRLISRTSKILSVNRRPFQLLHVVTIVVGLTMAGITFAIPSIFFPLTWIGPFLLCDGLVGYFGGRSLVEEISQFKFRLSIELAIAGLLCGFLWEFWNYWASPKWIYHVPPFDFLHLFEMPLLGYGGYLPFSWSVYQLLRIQPIKKLTSSH